nr:hypothetical protein [Tanacetum cinerariifolium]
MEERLVNGWMIIQRYFDELKIELEKIRSQISELQKKHLGQKYKIAFARFRISNLELTLKDIQARHQMAPKRTSTSAAPAMTQAAIRQLIANSVVAALEAQAATMANTNHTNKNTGPSETSIARKGTNDHKRKFNDRRNTTNNDNNNYLNNRDSNNYPNDSNNNNHCNIATITNIKITVTTITTNSRIEGKKLSRLMLPPQLRTKGILKTKGTMETLLCVQYAPCIIQDLAMLCARLATR